MWCRWAVPLLLLALIAGCRQAEPPREKTNRPKPRQVKRDTTEGPSEPAPRKREDLEKALESGNSASARRAAAFELGQLKAAGKWSLPQLAERVEKDDDASVRDMAAQAIGEIAQALPTPPAWAPAGPALLKRLRAESNPHAKRSIIYALGAYGKPAADASAAIKAAMSDDDASVRQNAAWALGRLGTGATELTAALRDKNDLVRRDAAQALGEVARAEGRAAASVAGASLISLATSEKENPVVKKAALASLVPLLTAEHVTSAPKLVPLLDSKDPETRRGAAIALAMVRGEQYKLRAPQLHDTAPEVRETAERELKAFEEHFKKAVPALAEALGDPEMQAQAAAALSGLGEAAAPASAALASALKESTNPIVRRNCAIALGTLKAKCPEDGVVALADALKVRPAPPDGAPAPVHDEEQVRHMAAEALSHIGYPANKAAMPAIRDTITKDPRDNHKVRLRLVEALFYVNDLQSEGLKGPLEKVLGETTDDHDAMIVRYQCARILAQRFHDKAPDATVGVLMHMLHNRKIKIFYETRASTDGVTEASKGDTRTATRTGGDARFMAAEGLGWLGPKASSNEGVMKALRAARSDPDGMLKKFATKAYSELGGKD